MLAAWLQKFEPGVFWASHASSAPVQAVYDDWNYFTPIEKGMPQNCSDDALLIADHITAVYARSSKTEMHELQDMFGLAEVDHFDDFAVSVLFSSLGCKWLTFLITVPSVRYLACGRTSIPPQDTLRSSRCVTPSKAREMSRSMMSTSTAPTPRRPRVPPQLPLKQTCLPCTTTAHPPRCLLPASVWKRLSPTLARGTRMKNCQGVRMASVNGCCLVLTPPACADLGYPEWADPLSVGCYNSHNASSPTFTDWSVEGRWDRQWVWMLCNEPFAFWQKLVNHSRSGGPD